SAHDSVTQRILMRPPSTTPISCSVSSARTRSGSQVGIQLFTRIYSTARPITSIQQGNSAGRLHERITKLANAGLVCQQRIEKGPFGNKLLQYGNTNIAVQIVRDSRRLVRPGCGTCYAAQQMASHRIAPAAHHWTD